MNLLRIVGNVEPIGPHQIILMLDEVPHRVVQLPGNLHTARPVVGIGDGGIPTFGESGGLGVEN